MYRNKRFMELNLVSIVPYLPFIIFTVLFLGGILIGNLTVGKLDYLFEYAKKTLTEFVNARQNNNLLNVLFDSLMRFLPIYLFVFLIGTSIVGCICAPFSVFAFGVYYGLVSGYLYLDFMLEGIMMNCLVLMPSVLVALYGLILLCKEAFAFSCTLGNICIKSNKPVNIYAVFKNYCFKGATTLICVVVSVVFDVCLSSLFLNYFDFINT